MSLAPYLPQDRLRALSRGEILPEYTAGSVMLADISGFTPLTEGLQFSLGPRKGAEELTRHLNAVFSALIPEVERYGGSVLSFAGDAITCWFDQAEGDSAIHAVAAAFAMQKAMGAFTTIPLPDETTTALSLKTAIASGPARRLVIGDPAIHYLDALAGNTVDRTSTGEHLANQGEILLDEATVEALGELLTVMEWRSEEPHGERFAVAEVLTAALPPPSLPPLLNLPPNRLQVWLPYAILMREQLGQSDFQTEFRPCAVLFVRFGGIDFESEDCQDQLDAFVSMLQSTAKQYDAVFLQLNIGDKGSYAYLNFGALQTHEDNNRRVVRAALDILTGSDLPLQIGIAAGPMIIGAYGSKTRKTFGALGDDVNLAARLMTTAAVGEILVSQNIHKATRADFNFEPRSPLPMKGKAEPLPVFAVTGERKKRALRLQEPNYALPMVGREQELALIEEKLDMVAGGQGQVIGIIAEAGLGKSRLVAEVIRSARRKGFTGFGGACQSDGIHTPYLAWKSIWQALFDVDPDMPERRLIRNLQGEIEDLAPERVQAMPLLNVILDLNMPENDFTQNLEPKIRQSALHALLEDCLKAQVQEEPSLIVIEDLHWIDALSLDLLEQLAKALVNHAVCFMMAYRPPEMERLQVPRLVALPQFTRVELHELTATEAESAIRAKLAQLYPARSGTLPEGLLDALMARAQGNPFYLEELLNYVHDRGLDPGDLNRIELPDSLHTLILSRIDQLSEQEKTTLRIASIIGRLFRARWLTGYYPKLGSFPEVKAALDALDSLDITPMASPEPELAYLFKHIVTHEVTYKSLPFATRARLHEYLARYLENQIEAGAAQGFSLLDMIAYHYLRSEKTEKQREYLRRAGEAAQKKFANDAALEYYGTLLPLLKDLVEKTQIHLKHGEVLELMGRWDEAEGDFRAALDTARDDTVLKSGAQFALGKLNRLRGDYKSALDWLARAEEARTALEDTIGLAEVLIETGTVMWRKGDYDKAREPLTKGLELAREAGDKLNIGWALHNLGNVTNLQGSFTASRVYYEESLVFRREIGDKEGISATLNNLGILALEQGDYAKAQALHEESLALRSEIGDKWGISNSLNNLGYVALEQDDYATARALLEESLALCREMGDKRGIAYSQSILGNVVLEQGDFAAAKALHEESLALYREMGDKRGTSASLNNLGVLALEQGNFAEALPLCDESLVLRREIGDKWGISDSLSSLGKLALEQGDYAAARPLCEESLVLCREMGNKRCLAFSLNILGSVALAKGDYAEAQAMHGESLALRRELGDRRGIATSLNHLGYVALEQGDFDTARAQLEESLALCKKMDEKTIMAYVLLGLGIVDLVENKPEAHEYISHSLSLLQDMSEQVPLISSLIGAAGLALQEGNPQFAAQLLGAVESALKMLNTIMVPEMIHFHAKTQAAAREQLGESVFQSAWEEGAGWALEETVAKVLADA